MIMIAQFVRLSNNQVVMVPEGADPVSFRKWQEARLRLKGRKPRRRAGSRTRRNSKRTNYAAQVVARGKAMAALVSRVNGDKPEANSWWTIEIRDFTASVDRETGAVSYEDKEEI